MKIFWSLFLRWILVEELILFSQDITWSRRLLSGRDCWVLNADWFYFQLILISKAGCSSDTLEMTLLTIISLVLRTCPNFMSGHIIWIQWMFKIDSFRLCWGSMSRDGSINLVSSKKSLRSTSKTGSHDLSIPWSFFHDRSLSWPFNFDPGSSHVRVILGQRNRPRFTMKKRFDLWGDGLFEKFMILHVLEQGLSYVRSHTCKIFTLIFSNFQISSKI